MIGRRGFLDNRVSMPEIRRASGVPINFVDPVGGDRGTGAMTVALQRALPVHLRHSPRTRGPRGSLSGDSDVAIRTVRHGSARRGSCLRGRPLAAPLDRFKARGPSSIDHFLRRRVSPRGGSSSTARSTRPSPLPMERAALQTSGAGASRLPGWMEREMLGSSEPRAAFSKMLPPYGTRRSGLGDAVSSVQTVPRTIAQSLFEREHRRQLRPISEWRSQPAVRR